MTEQEFEQMIKKETEGVSLEGCFIDPSKDYRRELSNYKLNPHGDLLILRRGKWEILIEKSRLLEPEWIAHLRAKQYISDDGNFGDFVRAYCKTLERMGVKSLTISIYGFNDSSKFADGT